jgi:hypothetical protein
LGVGSRWRWRRLIKAASSGRDGGSTLILSSKRCLTCRLNSEAPFPACSTLLPFQPPPSLPPSPCLHRLPPMHGTACAHDPLPITTLYGFPPLPIFLVVTPVKCTRATITSQSLSLRQSTLLVNMSHLLQCTVPTLISLSCLFFSLAASHTYFARRT